MSAQAWIAIATILSTLTVAIGGFLIRHSIQDAQDKGEIRTEIANIKSQIGTHETGLRGEQHRQTRLITRMWAVIYFISKRLNLDVMKDLDDDR